MYLIFDLSLNMFRQLTVCRVQIEDKPWREILTILNHLFKFGFKLINKRDPSRLLIHISTRISILANCNAPSATAAAADDDKSIHAPYPRSSILLASIQAPTHWCIFNCGPIPLVDKTDNIDYILPGLVVQIPTNFRVFKNQLLTFPSTSSSSSLLFLVRDSIPEQELKLDTNNEYPSCLPSSPPLTHSTTESASVFYPAPYPCSYS